MNESLLFPISIAPMMEWTDRHYRFLMRNFTKRTILYTEMVTAEAIIRGNRDKLLGKGEDNPVVLQIGGDDPEKIYKASSFAKDYGYDSVNLNVGCPSDRVQNGNFGACLMKDPRLVSELMIAMREGSQLESTVKHRIGIDGKESYEDLAEFVRIVSTQARVTHFIVHARIAILGGLSPKENRTIPPLRYEDVYRLKQDFPQLRIEMNGGILNLGQAVDVMKTDSIDSVMIGRAAYDNPFIFLNVDRLFDSNNHWIGKELEQSKVETRSFDGTTKLQSSIAKDGVTAIAQLQMEDTIPKNTIRSDASSHDQMESHTLDLVSLTEQIENYLEEHVRSGGHVHQVLRHAIGFFHGLPGSRQYRRYLSEHMHREKSAVDLFRRAVQVMAT
ncbi:tRNA dihydrouridine(20/20a) synthase DusA [Leptospira sp. GIMC2001]|uniref:tRNA dihydrouridine(20/20a) synthase DusA n=1 Tax=Leptospira sp. GIMC2001 TaxID=1513297 RepID=UPI00234A2E06|nr:tRNA dihydrouridine(20/20a) synthase DusA [Leptospira sp. GIMC2001]WCL50424.1 tRNA dihydrouridine(20/20a) synthase DusA [Leptospira sp. GIMC2001]